jgi:muconolactone delta-isomerase
MNDKTKKDVDVLWAALWRADQPGDPADTVAILNKEEIDALERILTSFSRPIYSLGELTGSLNEKDT